METIDYSKKSVNELTNEELLLVNGGGFAYDLGFLIRELVIYTVNGGNAPGSVAVATDLGINYRPVH
jgi:hypothetical protein